ncbi:hypothetical protein Q428_01670 [Fervidicella metallireducens AeB]|uniref:Alpha-clostripain-like protein n=1 Tax=Fervidicella metallireducens AeB TaxID=1403537 RepID=A0A017S0A1_9CLOT|nr:clostripain-related cysteine peptidase [Fervidicella metallireducens]EYE89585.1 hypothetical protein Q428_01670 [Fervidicella metallireducens AeB]
MKSISVLFYLDGNNEIEPEIYNSFNRIKNSLSSDVEIFIELGREKREFIKIIRPYEFFDTKYDNWNGVKRYHIYNGKIREYDLGTVNMANPKELNNFISWGLELSNSRKNILVIASHGFSILGGITDFTLDNPYLMSIDDMCSSIGLALSETKKSLDLLFLDMCYMNYIEILYELNQKSNVNKVLMYDGEGDFRGIDYLNFISNLKELTSHSSVVLDKLNFENMLIVDMNRFKLKKIKSYCDGFAKDMLNKGYKNIEDVKREIGLENIYREINKIILSKSKDAKGIEILNFHIDEIDSFNFNLSFYTNNNWIDLISNNHNFKSSNKEKFKPQKLSYSSLLGLILSLNPDISIKEGVSILNNLIKEKGWNFSKNNTLHV